MNGRIYDPTLGRFLQADPHIQAPKNSQSYNRYSYVLNNPLSYTDPSGYFFKALGKFVKKHWRTIVAVGLAAVGGYYALTALKAGAIGTAYGIAAATGFASGYVSTGSLKGALTGAFTSMAFLGVGQATMGMHGAVKALAHGVTGGIISDLQGGKFGHGFISAGLTKGAQVAGLISDKLIQGIIGSALVGGTISKITGNKFANGAITAAFQFAMNRFVTKGLQSLQPTKVVVEAAGKKYVLDARTRDQLCSGARACEATLASTPSHMGMARVSGNLFTDATTEQYKALMNAIKVDMADFVSNSANAVTLIVPAFAGPAQAIGTIADGVKLMYAEDTNAAMFDILTGKAMGGATKGLGEMGFDGVNRVMSNDAAERFSAAGELLYEGAKQ
ncbi:hypothetical protein OAP14_02615 [Aliiglaciecola sp.]|nr:hypothetical protein [Aliiglaciecola sp.]